MSHPYDQLSPDCVLNAIDSVLVESSEHKHGQMTSGHLMALNSYENRVYQIGIEDSAPVIAKFYRPDRWSDAAIYQEHDFSLAAKEDELPVIAPLTINDETLFRFENFRFALYPRQGGQSEHIEQSKDFEQMGRLLARLHQTANVCSSDQRPIISPEKFAVENRAFLLENNWIPDDLKPAYESVSQDVIDLVMQHWDTHQPTLKLVHGDLHTGNLIWYDQQPYMLDLDDCALAPRIQDIWMMLNGEREQMLGQLSDIARGYDMFLPFPANELPLIEPLRTMRLINYSAWLAKRWDDPAFPQAFPWFNTPRYWSEQILTLREQMAALQEPSLSLAI